MSAYPEIKLGDDPIAALGTIASYLNTVRLDACRRVWEDGELVGVWQTPDWLAGLREIAAECERLLKEEPTIIDNITKEVLSVVSQEGYEAEEWTQVREAVAKGINPLTCPNCGKQDMQLKVTRETKPDCLRNFIHCNYCGHERPA